MIKQEEGVTIINGQDRDSRPRTVTDDSARSRSTSPSKKPDEQPKRFLNG